MPIGTTAAIIGSAVIGAGASAIAASKNSKAIGKATDAQAQGNAASVALQREIYGQNKDALNPYVQRGNAAGDAINALLGLGGAQPNALAPTPQQASFNPSPLAFSKLSEPGYSTFKFGNGNLSFTGGIGGAPNGASVGYPTQQPAVPVAQPQPQQSAAQAQRSAFDVFRNSTGYNFRLGEGNDSINSAYAASGTLQSGAALKALARYNQDYASNEFGNYMGYLGGQQGIGLSGASALAGVGQSYANNVTNLNTANANALGQAAVARANNSNALIGNIGNSLNGALGYFAGGSSYGR